MTAKEILLVMASRDDLLRAANIRLRPTSAIARALAGNQAGQDIAMAIALAEDITGSEILELAKTA